MSAIIAKMRPLANTDRKLSNDLDPMKFLTIMQQSESLWSNYINVVCKLQPSSINEHRLPNI